MNIEIVRGVIERRFPLVQDISPTVFRTEDKLQGDPFAVYYFDIQERSWSVPPDLVEYQNALLAKDYYRHAGALQWNFYLIFVLGSQAYASLTSSAKENVEKNKVYSRKFLVRESDLREFLQVPDASTSEKRRDHDPSARWKQRLDMANLGDIYSRASKPEVLDRILEGRPSSPPPIPHLQGDSPPTEVGHVEELVIDKYRKFPSERHYHFAKVNLIRGANGSGKTSLLEAIEFCLCGNSYRNRDGDGDAHRSYKLKVKLKGAKIFSEFEPNNARLHKQRDLAWYGHASSTQGRSSLHHSFNRYNFYNTDFAYLLAHKDSIPDLKTAFTALALGDEANHIEKRLKDFYDEFERTTRDLGKREFDLKERQAAVESKLRMLGQIETRGSILFRELVHLGRMAGFEVQSSTPEDFLGNEHGAITLVREALKKTVSGVDWISPLTLEQLKTEQRRCESAVQAVEIKQEELKRQRHDLNSLEKQVESAERRARTLRQARTFFELPDALKVAGLSEQVKSTSSLLRRLKGTIEECKGLDLERVLANVSGDQEIDTSIEKLRQSTAKSHEHISRLRMSADEERAKIGRVASLVSEIRSLGVQYIQAKPLANECPMCLSAFPLNELTERVSRKVDLDVDDSALKVRISQIEEALVTSKDTERVLSDLKQLAGLIARLSPLISRPLRTISDMKIALAAIVDEASKAEQLLSSLESRAREFAAQGLTEALLNQIARDFEECGLSVKLVPESSTEYARILNESEEALRELLDDQKRKSKQHSEAVSAVATILEDAVRGQRPDVAEVTLQRRKLLLNESVRSIGDLPPAFALSDVEDLVEKLSSWIRVSELAEEFLLVHSRERRDEVEQTRAKVEIEKIGKDLAVVRAQLDRVRSAHNEISGILKDDNTENALKTFIDEYIDLIARIFRRIHAPKEFVGVVPESLGLARENGEVATLSSISTGQRSAFALSVFFALNSSLTSGPPIVMIDDPVAYVDDLNTLSFLDYLREIAVYENKQIFFATANDKLAALFERKFSFLSGEFKVHRFSRPE